MSVPNQMQYRPRQATQGQFAPVSGPSQPQRPYGYPQTTVNPMGQPSPPVYVTRAPTAPMTGIPQFQAQNFEPLARERKIQMKDADQFASSSTLLANSNKDVTQETLNPQPSQSSRGSTGGTSNNSYLDMSEQSAGSRTCPLSSQQQAEANVRAQFAAQVAATLAEDSKSKGSMSKDSEMKQYRPQQAMQGEFSLLAANAVPVVKASTAPMTGMPQFQAQNFEPLEQRRKIIQIKDANSNRDVTQEILNRQSSWSSTGSTGGTSSNSSLHVDTSEQSAGSRTCPLSSQQQAEANVQAQFVVLAECCEGKGSVSEDSEMEQYRLQQAMQGQVSPFAAVVRASTAPMTGMPQFQNQNLEPLARRRKIIQIKDASSNKDVTQEILVGTSSNSSLDTSVQSAGSRTCPLSSQQQAEANVRAQFAAQVAATLAVDSKSKASMSEDSDVEQYRPQQGMQGQFSLLAANAAPVVRASNSPMTGMPQFQTQNFEPLARRRKIIQIKDANSNKDVTQEILNRQTSWSSTGSSSRTSNNSSLDTSEQSAGSRTCPLSSQQQAEANVRAQFAAQVAATLAVDSKSTDIMNEDSEMKQYRPQQGMQGQFSPLAFTAASVVRASTAPMTGMPQFQTQNFEPLAWRRKIIQIKDANSNKDVTQEILNCQTLWSSTGRTSGTSNDSSLDTSEQSAGSRTCPLSSQQQAEANVRAQFAAQVAATLAVDSKSKASMSEDSDMEQYIPQQGMQGQFSLLAANAAPVVRASNSPMTGMPQFQTQNFEPLARRRKIIQIKDASSNKDVTQEILNCQTLWSSTGSTSGTSNNSSLDTSEQSAGSRTCPLSSQQQAEANVEAQFAAQADATLPEDSESKGSMSKDSKVEQYRTRRAMQGQFSPSATNAAPVVRASTAPLTEIPLFKSENFEPLTRRRKIIQIKDANSNKDVTQEILNRQTPWSSTGSFGGTSNNSSPDTSEHSAGSRTCPLSSQQQAEANVRAQFAAQVAAILAEDRKSKGSMSEDSEMEQYRPQQAMQGQFSPLAFNAAPVVRASTTFFEGLTRRRNIIQIKDANSNKDVAQEILNRQTPWSSASSTSGTSINSSLYMSEQSAGSRASPLLLQQQAETNVCTQFAVQVAATLAEDSESKGSMSEDSEMEPYSPQQAIQGQFSPLAFTAASVVRASTAPMTGMPQFQTQNFEPLERRRKIIQIKDANSNKDVTQEILNRQTPWSSTGSFGGTSNNSSLDTSEQSAGSRASPLLVQQQAETSVCTQFAVQVAATLAEDSESKGSMSEDSEMEPYSPQQGIQGQFSPLAFTATSVVRASTAPMTGMPQFQTQNFEPLERRRKIIQIKDANSNKDVTQEILNCQASWSLTGSTSGTSNNLSLDKSEQPAGSRTCPLSSQQQAEANVRAQFAAQVAATLAKDSERKGGMSKDSEMETYRPQLAMQGQFTKLAANAVNLVIGFGNRHEDAAQPLKNAELSNFRHSTDCNVAKEVDQQVAKLKSTAEASEGEVFTVTSVFGVEKVTVHGSGMLVYSVPKNPIDTDRTVPPEIVVRGRLALEAYNKALAEGKTFDNRVPVMLIGQDRSGKTSLKKSLRGEPFNRHEESTVGIDVDPSHFRVSTEIWKVGEKDQETNSKTSISYEYHAARATVENLKQGKSVLEEKIPMGSPVLANDDFISVFPASCSSVSDLSSASNQDPSCLGTSSLDSELGSHISHIPKDIENEMLKRMQNDHKMEDEEGIYSVLWDFAGQLVYYATHPLFLTSRAMYLLVNDLSQNPSETAKPVVKQGVYGTFKDSFGMKTNMDYLDFWMSSIASLACQNERGPIGSYSEVLPEKLPPVFLVCTHADRPYDGGDPSTLARELFGSLQTKPYNKHLHDVFVVDNTKSGLESECPEVVRLRNEVFAVAKELPQMKEAIPIKWLKFEKELRAMSKEDHKWISFETATNIASEKCNVVDSEEFKTLLNFLHDKRILIHFDDTPELNELVVLDPQWLIDVFKKVITVKPYDRQSKKFTELWRKLENKGILDEKLLEQVWGPLFDDRATCERLLQIMRKFSLLCPLPSSDSSCGKQYLVPAMLTTHPPEDIMNLVEVASKTIPPLFLKFESGQVPPGLFPRLVLLLLHCSEEIFLNPERTKLFHNFARFFTSEEENWSVILLCLSSSIKVVVHRENPIDESEVESFLSADANYGTSYVTFPCEVHRLLGKILESMRNEFCWLKYMRYEPSFICPLCCQGGAVRYCDTHHVQSCTQEECLHFWSQSQLCNAKGIISCTKSVAAVNSRVQTVQFTPWFTTQGNQLTTDQHDGDNLASVEESEAKALVCSSGVLKSLQTTCDTENVAALLAESLELDEATLADPGPEKTQLIRCLSMEAKNANRLDVVKHLREITPAGTTGPLLPECLDVTRVSQSQLSELTIHLCGGQEWKILAEKLGLSPAKIRFLDSRTLNPCMEVLFHIRKQRFLDVGTLYDALVECGFPMLADML